MGTSNATLSEAGAFLGHSPPLTALGSVRSASPVPASQLVRHRWLLPQPQPGGGRRSGPGRGVLAIHVAASSVRYIETPTGSQKPHWAQNTAWEPGNLCAPCKKPKAQSTEIKLERNCLEGPCQGPLTHVSKQFQMPLHQELRESVTELPKGCQLKVQPSLQGTPPMGNDQDHKTLWTRSLSWTLSWPHPKSRGRREQMTDAEESW